ncbi:MAG: hypothetical protein COV67_01235, partial [Nitrospinae bacterium CG11_big_fil_rev_8_21_14_0_20_56_8]
WIEVTIFMARDDIQSTNLSFRGASAARNLALILDKGVPYYRSSQILRQRLRMTIKKARDDNNNGSG